MGILIDTIVGCSIALTIGFLLYLNNRAHIFQKKDSKNAAHDTSEYDENDLSLPITQIQIGSGKMKRTYDMKGKRLETDMPEKGIVELSVFYRDGSLTNSLLNTDLYKRWYIDPYYALAKQRIYATYLGESDLTDKDKKSQEDSETITNQGREIAKLKEKLERKHMGDNVQDALEAAERGKKDTNVSPGGFAEKRKEDDKDDDKENSQYKEEDSENDME